MASLGARAGIVLALASAFMVELETLPALGMTVAATVVISASVASLVEERRAADLIMRRSERLGWGERRAWSLGAAAKLFDAACPDKVFQQHLRMLPATFDAFCVECLRDARYGASSFKTTARLILRRDGAIRGKTPSRSKWLSRCTRSAVRSRLCALRGSGPAPRAR